ncbi:MAG: LytTR family DNA-binding domain-containing protein [Bacteroidota bacterium]
MDWIYAEGNYCTIVLEDAKEFAIKASLNRLKTQLDEEIFTQTHRNYLVNLNKIEYYDTKGLVKIGKEELPVSRGYKKLLEAKFLLLG